MTRKSHWEFRFVDDLRNELLHRTILPQSVCADDAYSLLRESHDWGLDAEHDVAHDVDGFGVETA